MVYPTVVGDRESETDAPAGGGQGTNQSARFSCAGSPGSHRLTGLGSSPPRIRGSAERRGFVGLPPAREMQPADIDCGCDLHIWKQKRASCSLLRFTFQRIPECSFGLPSYSGRGSELGCGLPIDAGLEDCTTDSRIRGIGEHSCRARSYAKE